MHTSGIFKTSGEFDTILPLDLQSIEKKPSADHFSVSSISRSDCCLIAFCKAIGSRLLSLFQWLKSLFCCKRAEERDAEGFTPLSRTFQFACLAETHNELDRLLTIATALIESGADVACIDTHLVIINGEKSKPWRKFLVSFLPHADLSKKDGQNKTALQTAIDLSFSDPEGERVGYYLAIVTLCIKLQDIKISSLDFKGEPLISVADRNFSGRTYEMTNHDSWNNFYNFIAHGNFNKKPFIDRFENAAWNTIVPT